MAHTAMIELALARPPSAAQRSPKTGGVRSGPTLRISGEADERREVDGAERRARDFADPADRAAARTTSVQEA
jgi:hypothetical protein